MLKPLPTLLLGKAFVVFERIGDDKKEDFKVLIAAIKEAFGADETSKHIAMMEFRRRARKPGEDDIPVFFVYGLETLLSRAIPNIGNEERDTLLKQQFIEISSRALKRELYIAKTEPEIRGDRQDCTTIRFDTRAVKSKCRS